MNRFSKASATVEAALVMLPVMTFFLSIVWLIDVFRVHSVVGDVVTDAGNAMVNYAYAYQFLLPEDDENNLAKLVLSIGWSETYLKGQIEKSAAASKISSIVCSLAAIGIDDAVDISVTYRVKPLVKIPGINGMLLSNRFYSKAYFGGTDKSDGEFVYITKGTEVYHTSRECKALISTVQTVLFSELSEKRSNNGSMYYPCEKCSEGENAWIVYITPHGNRYHVDSACTNLQATVYRIPKSEAEGRRECYYCQNR